MSSVKLLGQDWQPDDWKDRDYIARAYNVKGYTKVTPEHAWVQMYIDAKNNTFGKSTYLPGSEDINSIEDVINHIEDTPEGTIPGSEWFRGKGNTEDRAGEVSAQFQYLPEYMGRKDLSSQKGGLNIDFTKQVKDSAPPPDPEKGQFNSVADIPKFYEGPQPVIQNVSSNGYVTYEPVTQSTIDDYRSSRWVGDDVIDSTTYWNIKDYAGFQGSGLVFDYNTNDWRPITDSERTDVNFAGQSLNLFTGNLWDNEKGAVSSSITDFYSGQAEPVEDSPQPQVDTDPYKSEHEGGEYTSSVTQPGDTGMDFDTGLMDPTNTADDIASESDLSIDPLINTITSTSETDQAIIRDPQHQGKIDLTTAGSFESGGEETNVSFDAITEGTEDEAYTTGADVTSFDTASSDTQSSISAATKTASDILTRTATSDLSEGPIPGKPAEGVRMKRSQAAKNRQGLLGTGQFRRTKDAEYTK